MTEPREKPILFSGPMVQAILAGRKTQTRRVLKPQPDTSKISAPFHPEPRGDRQWVFMARDDFPGYSYATEDFKTPYAVGDLLWVREAWRPVGSLSECTGPEDIRYRATASDAECATATWRPSIHMPREFSRITLRVTAVKVERLQDISETDAIAEGFARVSKDGQLFKYGIPDRDGLPGDDSVGWPWREWRADPRDAFQVLWSSINGPDSWEPNPWVAAYTFERVKP